jgi:alpha-glucosidase
VPIPPDKIQDPQGINLGPERSRDVCRTPMQWDAGPNAGFSPAGVETWLPLADDYAAHNVAALADDPTSIFTLYTRLLHLRRATPALYGGSYHPLDVGYDDVYAYLREDGGQRYLVALNFTAEPRTLAVPGETSGRVVLSTHLDREESVSLDALALRGNEGVLIQLS